MKLDSYRNLQLLHELSQNPQVTQRDLGRRVGLALGLINSRLRYLSAKGLIEILDSDKKRIRYQITPPGLMEKNRLIVEYLEYSFHYYLDVRRFLRERLLQMAGHGVQRLLVIGTGELAEVSFLTIQEVGLTLIGVVGEGESRPTFFNLPVRRMEEVPSLEFDQVIVAGLGSEERCAERLTSMGVPPKKILVLPDDPSSFSLSGLRDWFVPDSPAGKDLTPAMTDVVILCGGKGSRLGSLTADSPKPLLSVSGEPFLLRLIARLKREGFGRFVLAAHHLPERFEAFMADHRAELENVELVIEPEPLGTGGALRHAADHVASPIFVAMNGDTWPQQALGPVLDDHGASGREFSVVAVHSTHVEGEPLKKGVWKIGPKGEVQGFETQESVSQGWVNAGCYVLDRSMVGSWPVGSYSLETNLQVLLKGRKSGVFRSEGRMLDIGVPATYHRAAEVLESYGVADEKALSQESHCS